MGQGLASGQAHMCAQLCMSYRTAPEAHAAFFILQGTFVIL